MSKARLHFTFLLPDGYAEWRKDIEHLIEVAKLRTAINVNADTLALYWTLGKRILAQQRQLGWGANIISKLSVDLSQKFPNDRGYSLSNLKSMRRFAEAYHHISLLSKVKDIAERAYYITETAQNGWSRDVMLLQIDNGYIHAKGHAINNFEQTLPPPQSDLARYIFKDPYNFSFIGTVALQNELDIEKSLTCKITDFLLEMGRGFAYIGRQYHISVDGDDYYIDLLMYHLKLHCYVVVELKAVEFKPEFVSKLNFYISAVDDMVKSPEDKPTIGLLLCRTKSNKKAEFSLRGITQPMGIAQYETEKLFADVASALPQIEEIENKMEEE